MILRTVYAMRLAFFEHWNNAYNIELTLLFARAFSVHLYSKQNLVIPGVHVRPEGIPRSIDRLVNRLRPRRLRKPLRQSITFLDLLFRRYDLVHVNKVYQAIDVLQLKRRGKVPYIFTTQDCPSRELEFSDSLDIMNHVSMAHESFSTAASNAACVVTVSKHDQKCVEKEYNVKSRVIHNGANIQEFNPSISGRKIRRKYGIDDSLILFVGRLAPIKDPMTIIHSVPYVVKEQPNAKFMLIGKGILERLVQEEVKRLGLQDSVILPGYVDHKDLNEYYAASDLFVLPSIYEPFGIVVVEAMASNKPTILSDIPSFRELFSDCSLFFEKSNSEDLAEKILHLLSNKEFAIKLSKKGCTKTRTHFTWDVAARRYLEIYKQVVQR